MNIAFQGMKNSCIKNEIKPKQQCQKFDNITFKKIFDDMPISDIKFYPMPPKDTIECTAPKISIPRVFFHRFTKDQIEAVNKSGKLPQNAKFTDNGGNVSFTWNLADITTGTHILPKGYEVKNDILGFTHVVREGTKNLFIK
ncbi:MAG: hypothetical protein LUH05_09135 [Candidatus Gastranaerophilales bacterium]|nr:hypothetical protein [Candidatus Gastranaerophilales bacterium]